MITLLLEGMGKTLVMTNLKGEFPFLMTYMKRKVEGKKVSTIKQIVTVMMRVRVGIAMEQSQQLNELNIENLHHSIPSLE